MNDDAKQVKLTISDKDALSNLAAEVERNGYAMDPGMSLETSGRLCEAGMVDWTRDDGWFLTDAGKALVEEHKANRESARQKRNAAGRGRHRAMTGVGMRRMSSGWE